MKHLSIAALALSVSLSPAWAQQEDEGLSLMEQGARLFFKGIMQEMEPALEDLQSLAENMEPALKDFAEQMGPALRGLMAEVEDWSAYHPPEMMPNGDIILRRKTPAEQEAETEEEIEL